MASIFSFACDWARRRHGFVVHNNTLLDIFEGLVQRSLNTALATLEDIASISTILIADGILVSNAQ